MAYVNIKQVISEISTSSRGQLEALAYGAAKSRFDNIKEEFIEEFENHDVSKELKAGPEASSQFLSKGNLFSALGFHEGSNPVNQISETLKSDLKVRRAGAEVDVIPEKLTFHYQFPVEAPTLQEIKDQATLEWTSRNWIDQIEKGIDELTMYIFKRFFDPNYSRSTTGLQKKRSKSSAIIYHPPSSYFTEMWKKFKNRLRS